MIRILIDRPFEVGQKIEVGQKNWGRSKKLTDLLGSVKKLGLIKKIDQPFWVSQKIGVGQKIGSVKKTVILRSLLNHRF